VPTYGIQGHLRSRSSPPVSAGSVRPRRSSSRASTRAPIPVARCCTRAPSARH
jgi:hypothetical protein